MTPVDGQVPEPRRVADVLAIQDLAISYAHAVDDRDWVRFEALFVPDANIDYTSSGGMAGSPAEVATWMPDAMSVFTWCMHSISTHEIRFTSEREATGSVHVFNRNGVDWEGEREVLDVVGFYFDRYVLDEGRWRFSERVESVRDLAGGNFAEVVRSISSLAEPS
jgi:hypothetical protein